MGPRPGRNDPCQCGSGRKFKKCCIDDLQPWIPRTQTERETVMVIEGLLSVGPASPTCPGPIVVHETGASGCAAPDGCAGDGVRFAKHERLTVVPCPGGVDELPTTCRRCVDDVSVPEGGPGASVCTGTLVEHQDGMEECDAGAACLGAAASHVQGMSCSMFATMGRPPCKRCG